MKVFEFLLLVLSLVICGSALAAQFTTTTGKGYYSWNGQVISYYSFTPGSTFDLVNGVTATDTNGAPDEPINQEAFNSYLCVENGKC